MRETEQSEHKNKPLLPVQNLDGKIIINVNLQ